ncbi:MAG: hypothetical protein ACT6UL_06760 [Sphingopyxis sp.]|uniref:hypothetical protein n=1 Tax=Sphingopyxis sp. TaxID=1908224 RepID=UPI00286C87BA|nr:hypothetical protein [Sphingopyxis sp. BE249]
MFVPAGDKKRSGIKAIGNKKAKGPASPGEKLAGPIYGASGRHKGRGWPDLEGESVRPFRLSCEGEFPGFFSLRRGDVDRVRRGLDHRFGREDQARCKDDQAKGEIADEGLDREEEERRDEGEAQPQRVEAKILANGLADTEEGIAAAEEVGGFVFHLFCLSLWLQALPRADAECIAKVVPIFASPRFPSFFISAALGGLLWIVNQSHLVGMIAI